MPRPYLELLSPARNADIGIEAINHGADAVYIGGPDMGARDKMAGPNGLWPLDSAEAKALPVIGRVSMDLLAVDVTAAPNVAEGDWLAVDFALPEATAQSGLSQYELLTGLGARYARVWG